MSKTSDARDLRNELVKKGYVSIFFSGLMGDSLWITRQRRAYRLTGLPDGHLSNIILKYISRGEEVPGCITSEKERRATLRSQQDVEPEARVAPSL